MLDDMSSLDEIDLFVERPFVQLLVRGWDEGNGRFHLRPFCHIVHHCLFQYD